MTVMQHATTDLFLLLWISFLCGCILGAIYPFVICFACIPELMTIPAYPKYSRVKALFKNSREQRKSNLFIAITDFCTIVVSAVILLIVTFIYNSGMFRFIAFIPIVFGFFICRALFSVPINAIVTFIFYSLKILAGTLFFPIKIVYITVAKFASKIITKISTEHKKKQIEKYTKEKFASLSQIAYTGMLDDAFFKKQGW